ncbi:MAG: hypothetical protein FWC17_06070, partial [Treponema sp.]|nr:hypothetical protein [Treponema sp.]
MVKDNQLSVLNNLGRAARAKALTPLFIFLDFYLAPRCDALFICMPTRALMIPGRAAHAKAFAPLSILLADLGRHVVLIKLSTPLNAVLLLSHGRAAQAKAFAPLSIFLALFVRHVLLNLSNDTHARASLDAPPP